MKYVWLLSIKVTFLEVFIQLEKPVENPEDFLFIEKCAVLKKGKVQKSWKTVKVH